MTVSKFTCLVLFLIIHSLSNHISNILVSTCLFVCVVFSSEWITRRIAMPNIMQFLRFLLLYIVRLFSRNVLSVYILISRENTVLLKDMDLYVYMYYLYSMQNQIKQLNSIPHICILMFFSHNKMIPITMKIFIL